ncbi:hypothetical protein C7M84_020334 [Penaeus vannamei]|uniref:UNC93-like protein n=1 Tax=Penaeus vannamei TaxID=6689 RepID=A0A3R7SHU5_PENVA|nr:hypothetical protein C7M84_020334 [Penaeus vannamei]
MASDTCHSAIGKQDDHKGFDLSTPVPPPINSKGLTPSPPVLTSLATPAPSPPPPPPPPSLPTPRRLTSLAPCSLPSPPHPPLPNSRFDLASPPCPPSPQPLPNPPKTPRSLTFHLAPMLTSPPPAPSPLPPPPPSNSKVDLPSPPLSPPPSPSLPTPSGLTSLAPVPPHSPQLQRFDLFAPLLPPPLHPTPPLPPNSKGFDLSLAPRFPSPHTPPPNPSNSKGFDLPRPLLPPPPSPHPPFQLQGLTSHAPLAPPHPSPPLPPNPPNSKDLTSLAPYSLPSPSPHSPLPTPRAAEAGESAAAVAKQKELTKEQKQEKFQMLKNVFIISIAFMFLFTSFNSMANLQSSINKVEGTAALSTLYAALVISCAFVPTWMIKKFKAKWTLAVSMLGYSTYIAAQFYPRVWTLVPTSILLGLGAAPMWSAKCTYLTQVGTKYAALVGEKRRGRHREVLGIFFLFFQSTQVWGNLISSSVLSQGKEVDDTPDEVALLSCGVNFCPHTHAENNNTNLAKPPESQIYTMASIYLACALLSSVIIAVFVDPLTKYGEDDRVGSSTGKSGLALLSWPLSTT